MHLHALAVCNGFGRVTRAIEVGRINRIQRDICKAVSQIRQLLVRPLGEQTVVLSVTAAIYIALCLGVTNQIDCCHTSTAPVRSVTFSMPC